MATEAKTNQIERFVYRCLQPLSDRMGRYD